MSNKPKRFLSRACLAICLVLPFAMLQSCKTKQRAAEPAAGQQEISDLTTLEQRHKNFRNLTAKAEVSFGGSAFSLSGTLRLVPDSAMMISVQPVFGIEMARVLCTQDSIFVVNKFNKNYFSASYSDIYSKGGLDLQMIQGLFCNMPWGLSQGDFSMSRYDRDSYVVTSDGEIESTFLIDDEGSVLRTTVENRSKNLFLLAEYSDFMPVKQRGDYPLQTKLVYSDGKNNITVSVRTSSVTFDRKVNVGISIPSGYKKAGLEDLMKLLPL